MKGTRHNGRSGKNGVYNPLHNDRRFNPEHSEHIDNDKAVEKVAKEAMLATRRDDIRLAEDSKKWIQDPKHKASKREKDYAIKRLDGLIRKIETAMEKVVIRITKQLKQPEKKKAVVEEIKKEVKPSIRERLAQNVAKIQREEAERKQLNKGKSCSSDLEL